MDPSGRGEGEGQGGGPADRSEAGLVFVQEGIVVPADLGAEGQALAEGQVLVARSWLPGEEVELTGRLRQVRQQAPDHAACVALFRVGLGGRQASAVRFDAEGARLRVERQGAEALVVDAWTGVELPSQGFVAAPERPSPVPAGCPVEHAQQPALTAPDGLRHAVVEGPFTEPSGETGWRVVVLR